MRFIHCSTQTIFSFCALKWALVALRGPCGLSGIEPRLAAGLSMTLCRLRTVWFVLVVLLSLWENLTSLAFPFQRCLSWSKLMPQLPCSPSTKTTTGVKNSNHSLIVVSEFPLSYRPIMDTGLTLNREPILKGLLTQNNAWVFFWKLAWWTFQQAMSGLDQALWMWTLHPIG